MGCVALDNPMFAIFMLVSGNNLRRSESLMEKGKGKTIFLFYLSQNNQHLCGQCLT